MTSGQKHLPEMISVCRRATRPVNSSTAQDFLHSAYRSGRSLVIRTVLSNPVWPHLVLYQLTGEGYEGITRTQENTSAQYTCMLCQVKGQTAKCFVCPHSMTSALPPNPQPFQSKQFWTKEAKTIFKEFIATATVSDGKRRIQNVCQAHTCCSWLQRH